MFAQIGANSAAVRAVADRLLHSRIRAFAGIACMASILGGCIQAVPLAGPDPADPAAKVAGVGYRPVTAPYSSLRPVAPSGWREQNRDVTPPPKSGHEH